MFAPPSPSLHHIHLHHIHLHHIHLHHVPAQVDEERRNPDPSRAAVPASPPASAPAPPHHAAPTTAAGAAAVGAAAPVALAYAELEAGTSSFAQSALVGVGGFGCVYRAESAALPSLLQHGACAVKRLNNVSESNPSAGRGGMGGRGKRGGRGGRGEGATGPMAEVLREVELLGRCGPHANLLPLLGYCRDPAHPPCLVYPLCLGGTLEDRLLPHLAAAQARLAALGWAAAPDPLTWRARLVILRGTARALAHLHAHQLLHGDIKPSNILLDVRSGDSSARLADFGLSRVAKRHESAGASMATVTSVKGTAAFLDPIYMASGVATELSDAFALGVTALMVLTGLPSTDIKQRCRHMLKHPARPERWQAPGVPDEAAGSWDGAAASEILEICNGLDERWAEDRMPLREVLERLEAVTEAAGSDAGAGSGAEVAGGGGPSSEAEEEVRMCIVCEAAPREVRFACGHAVLCASCLPSVVRQYGKCPNCNAAFGAQPVLERGQHVGVAPTFVLPT